jgi:putative pyruvate formate lyase activating enzyme
MFTNAQLLTPVQWDEKIARARALCTPCRLCPRNCGVDRTRGEKGFCGAPAHTVVSSAFAHHGEEPPISGSGGSGTIFFSHCTLHCDFCQNYQISQCGVGDQWDEQHLASQMLSLQSLGCHNINLVTATHFLPWILQALRRASDSGLQLPIVYNCGGYESLHTLEVLRGVVDIYLPDMKYCSSSAAYRFSHSEDYPRINRRALRAMFGQVGPLRCSAQGLAVGGLIVRHLVLPENLAGSISCARWLGRTFDPADITISCMSQYRPMHRATKHPQLNRTIDPGQYERVVAAFTNQGFSGFYQQIDPHNSGFVIDFTTHKSQRLI